MGKLVEDGTQLRKLHDIASSPYGEWADFAREVELVWKGIFGLTPKVEESEIEIVRPSQPRNILAKLERMLGVRSNIKLRVVPRHRSQDEIERADRLERALRAFLWQHADVTQRNVFRDGVFFALLRGRGPWHVRYTPDDKQLKLRIYALDPLEVFPAYGLNGVRYFTTERYLSRVELEDYLESMPDEQRARLSLPDLRRFDARGLDTSGPWDTFNIIEYWDDEYFAWSIDNHLVECVKHDYGYMTFSEAIFNSTPLSDKRWAAQGVLGPVIEDLKQIAALQAKVATAVEAFYYPLLIYKTTSGRIATIDSREVGEWEAVDESFTPIVLNPTANDQLLGQLMNMFQINVGQGTINPIVFTTELPNVSGFMVSQILSTVKDDIADYRDGLERSMARVLSCVLRLMERFADEQEGGAWELPLLDESTGRRTMERITAADIDGHYQVEVNVEVDLPQDMLQKATIFNQLYQLDQRGKPRVDFQTALQLSGLADAIGDVSGMIERVEWEWLKHNHPEAAQLYTERLLAKYQPELEQYRKQAEQARKRQKAREERRRQRTIEQGASRAVIIPAEIATNAESMHQFATLIENGLTPQAALEQIEAGGLPLGSPEQIEQTDSVSDDETQALLDALFGPSTRVAPAASRRPDGYTGYSGIAPAALPPAMQGASPRQVVDRDRLYVENVEEQAQRGALPPRK